MRLAFISGLLARSVVVAGCVIVLISGCASPTPSYNVGINSIDRGVSTEGMSYLLLPSEGVAEANELQYIEFSNYVRMALSERGFVEEDDPNKADLAIYITYGIGDPATSNYTVAIPVFGQTGISSSHTTGSVSRFGNSATYRQTTTNIPSYGLTGFHNVERSSTQFTRHVFLTAYDFSNFRETDEFVVLWDTRIVSIGSSGDLRQVFPVMIAAAMDQIGTNTGKILTVSIKERDRRVRFLKGEVPTPRR